jgi:hypothetical protein
MPSFICVDVATLPVSPSKGADPRPRVTILCGAASHAHYYVLSEKQQRLPWDVVKMVLIGHSVTKSEILG